MTILLNVLFLSVKMIIKNSHCNNGNWGYHGLIVANIIGELYNGVASKANIYGIALWYGSDDIYIFSLIKALEYVKDSYLDLTKPV